MSDRRVGRTQEQINRGLSKDGEFIGWTNEELGLGNERRMKLLTDAQLAQVDAIINETETEGDFVFNGEDSLWEESARETLVSAARRVREYLRSLERNE